MCISTKEFEQIKQKVCDENMKAHFFRVIKHEKWCRAYELYSKDYEESFNRIEE